MSDSKLTQATPISPNAEFDSGLRKSDIQMNEQQAKAQIKQMAEVALIPEEELAQKRILYPGMKDRGVLNSFRELRTKLMQKSKGENFICMVSSLAPEGGGTFVALNLAASIALDKSKTSLLIDCNLYAPSVDTMLNIVEFDGVTDFIDDAELEIKDIIYASGIPRLRVIPVGTNREAGAEHYASPRMKEFIRSVKARYEDRFIIIDAPPIVSSAEAKILADLCDMAVLVLPYGKVSAEQIKSGVSALGKDKLAGIVFNN